MYHLELLLSVQCKMRAVFLYDRQYETVIKYKASFYYLILLVIRFMADLLRKYRRSVVIMVGRGGAEPHYVHNWPPIFSW